MPLHRLNVFERLTLCQILHQSPQPRTLDAPFQGSGPLTEFATAYVPPFCFAPPPPHTLIEPGRWRAVGGAQGMRTWQTRQFVISSITKQLLQINGFHSLLSLSPTRI